MHSLVRDKGYTAPVGMSSQRCHHRYRRCQPIRLCVQLRSLLSFVLALAHTDPGRETGAFAMTPPVGKQGTRKQAVRHRIALWCEPQDRQLWYAAAAAQQLAQLLSRRCLQTIPLRPDDAKRRAAIPRHGATQL